MKVDWKDFGTLIGLCAWIELNNIEVLSVFYKSGKYILIYK